MSNTNENPKTPSENGAPAQSSRDWQSPSLPEGSFDSHSVRESDAITGRNVLSATGNQSETVEKGLCDSATTDLLVNLLGGSNGARSVIENFLDSSKKIQTLLESTGCNLHCIVEVPSGASPTDSQSNGTTALPLFSRLLFRALNLRNRTSLLVSSALADFSPSPITLWKAKTASITTLFRAKESDCPSYSCQLGFRQLNREKDSRHVFNTYASLLSRRNNDEAQLIATDSPRKCLR